MNTLLNRPDISARGFSLVAEKQSMTDTMCHVNRLKQVLHLMEEDWSELEADDNVCTRTAHCVKLANRRAQSQIPNLSTHTALNTPASSLLRVFQRVMSS